MKTLLAILLICTLKILIQCDNELLDGKIISRTYPKKIRTPIQRSIKIINARKFQKLKALESRKTNNENSFVKLNNYTVFPPIAEKKIYDVPENLQLEGDPNRKPRVKKVLPEYKLAVFRRKRSADTYTNNTWADKVAKRNIKRERNKRKGIKKNVRNSISKKLKNNKSRNIGQQKVRHLRNRIKNRNSNSTKLSHMRDGKKGSNGNVKSAIPIQKHLGPNKHAMKSKKPSRGRNEKKQKLEKVRSRRLIAGRDAMIEDYPYVVSIQKDNRHWGAGALLNPRLVITTANCVWKAKRVSRMRVRAGSRHMERGGQLVRIQEVVKHPQWSIRSLPDNDVALLLLNKNIKFSDSVHAVDLPNRAMWPAFEDVWVTSWGAERRDGIFKSMGVTLQVYHAMLMDHDKCNNITQRFGVAVSRNFICVAQTGRRAPCTRDTGAPAVSDGILWGLASWGIRKLCGTERFPAMFSYLASRSNLDFITNATHLLMSDQRFNPFGDRFVVNRAVTTSAATASNFF